MLQRERERSHALLDWFVAKSQVYSKYFTRYFSATEGKESRIKPSIPFRHVIVDGL